MTQLDTKPKETKDSRKRGWVVGLAAAAVMILVVAVSLLRTEDGSVVDGPVTTTVAVAPSTIDAAEAAWEAIPPFTGGGPVDAIYRTAIFDVPFSFSGASGWSTVESTEESFVIELQPGPTLVHFGVLVRPGSIDETIEEFVIAHDALPDAAMTTPVAVTVAGASGVMFDTVGLPLFVTDAELIPWAGIPDGFSGIPVLGGGQGLMYVIDVDGTTVVVGYDTTPGAYADYLDDAQAIIGSIGWKDLD